MNNNLVKYDTCGRFYIIEEYNDHVCQVLAITIFDTDGNRWGSYDKVTFFPLPPFPKRTDENLHDDEKNHNRRRLDRTEDRYKHIVP
jgi:hypothetical protein